jgi:hypothetical protein
LAHKASICEIEYHKHLVNVKLEIRGKAKHAETGTHSNSCLEAGLETHTGKGSEGRKPVIDNAPNELSFNTRE